VDFWTDETGRGKIKFNEQSDFANLIEKQMQSLLKIMAVLCLILVYVRYSDRDIAWLVRIGFRTHRLSTAGLLPPPAQGQQVYDTGVIVAVEVFEPIAKLPHQHQSCEQ
jgi:hypothetical protein